MKQITLEREARGWTRAELARRARLNPSTVGLIEAGRLVPYAGQLAKLARVLGIAQSNLLDDVEEHVRQPKVAGGGASDDH